MTKPSHKKPRQPHHPPKRNQHIKIPGEAEPGGGTGGGSSEGGVAISSRPAWVSRRVGALKAGGTLGFRAGRGSAGETSRTAAFTDQGVRGSWSGQADANLSEISRLHKATDYPA